MRQERNNRISVKNITPIWKQSNQGSCNNELYFFQHKLIQEYVAAIYICSIATDDIQLLNSMFSSCSHVEDHVEVVAFCSGLLRDDLLNLKCFVGHITSMYAERVITTITNGEYIFDNHILVHLPIVLSHLGSTLTDNELSRLEKLKDLSNCIIHVDTGSYDRDAAHCIYARHLNTRGEEEVALVMLRTSVEDCQIAMSFYDNVKIIHFHNLDHHRGISLFPSSMNLSGSAYDRKHNSLHFPTSIVKVNASRFSLTKADIEALATGIQAGQFPNLEVVNLTGYDFSKSLHLVHLLPGLEELDVSGKDISNSLHLLTENVQTSLIRLNVSNCNLSITDIEALAAGIEAGQFPQLKEVDVRDSDLSNSLHLVHLLPGLEELHVSGKDLSNSLHLLTEHVQTSLIKLVVSKCKLTRADIEALAAGIEAGRFPQLKGVDVSDNDLSKSLHLLTEHLHASLVKLNVSNCNLTRADIEALAAGIEAGRFPQLKEVHLRGNDLSNSLNLLTEHLHTHLVKLDISHCNLTRADIEALTADIEAGRLPNLQQVNLPIEDIIKCLPNSLHLVHLIPGLEELDVSRKDISNSLHLLTKHMQHFLVKLNLGKRNLTRAVIDVLSTAITEGKFPKLKEIGIGITSSVKPVHLLAEGKFPELKEIGIGSSSKHQSVEPFQLLPEQTELDLGEKDISNVLHLLLELVQTSLVKLNVNHCNLTRADIEALAAGIEAGRFPKLKKVDVRGNDLSKSLHLVHLLPGLEELDVSRKDVSNSLHHVHLLPGLKELDVSEEEISNSLHLLTEHLQASLIKLNVSNCNLTRADIEALAAGIEAGRFPLLKEVDVWGNDLSKSLHLVHLLPGLKELDVSGKDISNSLHRLTEQMHTSLVKLRVRSCNLTIADIEALAAGIEAGRFPQLKEVDVWGNDLSKSLHLVHLLPGLEELDVSREDISNSLHQLTNHTQHSLVKLDLGKRNLTRTVMEVLSNAITEGKFPKLKEIGIDITSTHAKRQSVQSFQLLSGQTELNLSGKDIINSLHLLTEHMQNSLIKLNVSNYSLTITDIEALAAGIEAGRFPQLKVVDVRGNDLSKSLHLLHLLPGLEELDVSGKGISNSLHLLTEHLHANLIKLRVCSCNLTTADMEALAAGIEAGRFPQLKEVNLRGNDLSKSLHLVHLLPVMELDVSGKDISNSLHLLTEHVQTSLCSLHVWNCSLTGSDVSALAAALTAGRLPCLQIIDLGRNNLRNSLHLLTEHEQTSLCGLGVEKCSLTGSDVSALAAALTAGRLPCLHWINMCDNALDGDAVQPLCEALLQYEGPDQTAQSILTVWLWHNKIYAQFIEQWKEKLKHKQNVQVKWTFW